MPWACAKRCLSARLAPGPSATVTSRESSTRPSAARGCIGASGWPVWRSSRSLWLYEPVIYGALRLRVDELAPDAAAEVRRVYERLDPVAGGNDPWLEGFIDHWNGSGSWKAMSESARDRARRVGSTPAALAIARGLAEVNPQARLELLSDQGHMAPAIAPDSVWPSLRAHLLAVGLSLA
ncbi:MAG TPA: hypothetical protein VF169_05310 [Albitalea sp.]|uniref:hypothetical protein n=1 Tax=Piscinibacter sp. TaxID=1903157 RepID=UPI002ED56F34